MLEGRTSETGFHPLRAVKSQEKRREEKRGVRQNPISHSMLESYASVM